MGAVLHTLNLRLSPSQLAFIVNHGGDRVVIVDSGLAPLMAAIRPQLTKVERVIVVGGGDTSGLGDVIDYNALLAGSNPLRDWPALDERQAAAMCYTTGTTGEPRGVVYSHRSIWMHSFSVAGAFGLNEDDGIGLMVPMFHVNGWGQPYAALMCGADLLLPERFLQPQPLLSFVLQERPTIVVGVPTIFQGLLVAAEAEGADLGFIRLGSGRRLGGADQPDAGLREVVPADPGLGDDRDQPARNSRLPAPGGDPGGPPLLALPVEDRTSRPRSRAPHRRPRRRAAALGRQGGGGDRGARAVDHRLVLRRRPGPSASTTAGCAPATSPPSTSGATSRSPTGPRTSSSQAVSGSARWSWRIN